MIWPVTCTLPSTTSKRSSPRVSLPSVGDSVAIALRCVTGAFLVYQFSPKVLDFIKPHFKPIKRGFEWVNVPPATLFWAYNGEAKA